MSTFHTLRWIFSRSDDAHERGLVLKCLHLFSGKLRSRLITNEAGDPYLQRYAIYGWLPGDNKTTPINVYLHRFFRPDEDRAVHNRLKGDTYHRITELHGETWTLFITSKKHGRSWGFLEGNRFVPWRQRLSELGIALPEESDS